ncbi:MAG TPA: adenylate/guanylate cyclase domain-containing protein [Verrucomicrobiae bacterium]|nr:adenylate/guanylate cyclase domain-containing protein [Verrucomicrobiae bacterium]
MKLKPFQRTAILVALFTLALICIIRLLNFDFFDRLEWMTYDLRVRAAQKFPAPAATNLAFVSIEESSIKAVASGSLGYQFDFYWPRQVYGRLIEELSAQNAKAVAFDILFGDLRPDQPPVQMSDNPTDLMESDDFFALQMRRDSNVILATTPETVLPELFATNSQSLGDISSVKDSDGAFRRVQAFCTVRRWHPLFEKLAADPEFGVDLNNARIEPDKIILPQTGTTNSIEIPIDAGTNFSLADFIGDKLPAGVAPKARAFADERVWHMGIVLAARQLGLDLDHAEIDLPHGKIVLHGPNDVERVIPVDQNANFLVDWQLKPDDSRLTHVPIERLLWQDKLRLSGKTNGLRDDFRDKLVTVIYVLQGNNLTDEGATPLDKHTLLASVHWNVANSIIMNRFIRRASLPVELALMIFLGVLTAFVTWQLRAFLASTGILLLMAAYVAVAFFIFIEYRYWLPVIFPVLGAMLIEHVSLVTYRVVFEEREQRRVKSVFSKIVSPDVVNELLRAKKLSLGGARREITVFFADVRGFTTLTDEMQQQMTEFVTQNKFDTAASEKYFDESAGETLETVNLYLAAVADAVKKHGGTLDKYIGDCVMAFWGAPTNNERHALACVHAAIDAQRAIHELNRKRAGESSSLEIENSIRVAAGLPPKPLLRPLQLGIGVNTGLMNVGLMGSDAHILNYTVFGREVNLASRLEGVASGGQIVISRATYNHLLRADPMLASLCVEMSPVTVKGIRETVRVYEVPWSVLPVK